MLRLSLFACFIMGWIDLICAAVFHAPWLCVTGLLLVIAGTNALFIRRT